MAVWDDAVFLWDPNADGWSWDRVRGLPAYGVSGLAAGPAVVGVPVSDGGIDGRLYNGGDADRFTAPFSPLVPPQEWSIFAVVRLNGASRVVDAVAFGNSAINNQWANIRAANATTGLIGLRLNNQAAGANFINLNPASLGASTAKHVYVGVFTVSGGAGTIHGFLDSSTEFGNATGTPSLTGIMDRLSIGEIPDLSPAASVNGEVYAAAAWDRVLSGAEIDEILADPYAYLSVLTTPIPRTTIFADSAVSTIQSFITIPTEVQTGDDLYVTAVSRDHTSGTALATCTDDDTGGNTWTLQGVDSDRKGYVFWKKGTAGTAGKLITFGGAVGSCQAGLTVWSGCDPGDPTANLSVEINASGNESHAGFTPTRSGSGIMLAVFDTGNDTNVVTVPQTTNYPLAVWVDRPSTGGNDCRMTAAAHVNAPGSATGDFSWVQGNSTTVSIVWEVMGPEAAVTIDTEAARLGLRSATTTLSRGATTVDTEAGRLRLRSAVTTVDAGGVTVNTDASHIGLRAAETTVDVATAVNTNAARLRLRSAATTITLGQVIVETTAGHVRLRSADTSVEVGAATVDTLAARLRTRAAITSVFTGARFIPEITCETLSLGAVCGVTSLPVESAILTLSVKCGDE